MPVVILVIAVLMTAWMNYRQRQQAEQIERFVQQIASAVAADRDLTGKLNPAVPFTEQQTIQQLKGVITSPQALSGLVIRVVGSSADGADGASAYDDGATHSAILSVGGTDRLGLRVHHPGDDPGIRIVGYWLPQ